MNTKQDYPKLWIGEVPWIEISTRPHPPAPDVTVVQKLIEQFARPDFPSEKLLPCVSGRGFPPTGWRPRGSFYSTYTRPNNAEPPPEFRRLVELGCAAIPALLENLDNTTATSLEMSPVLGFGFTFQVEFGGNTANPEEGEAMQRLNFKEYPHAGLRDSKHYVVCLGDLCYAALGRIVARQYSPAQIVPTAVALVSSPARNSALREAIRAIWGKDGYTEHTLFRSLLRDFATRGDYDENYGLGWGQASSFQTMAAMRLLYYFPDQCAGFIARRLESLEVRKVPLAADATAAELDMKALRKQCLANGVYAKDLIEAVRWSKHPAIRRALAKLARRTNDPAIRQLITVR